MERFEVRCAPPPATHRASRLVRVLVAGMLPVLAVVGALTTLAAIDRDFDRTARRIAGYVPYEAAASHVAAMLATVKGPSMASERAPEAVPASLGPAR
ncbi:hypothetical protein [Marinimicrococcus flavescens]|uniref:hypothetical protein n=1 Tax=Marinimicrococcus flavescens TaxID=3031815 RepID=UPI002E18A402